LLVDGSDVLVGSLAQLAKLKSTSKPKMS